jgi:hypothetical protein
VLFFIEQAVLDLKRSERAAGAAKRCQDGTDSECSRPEVSEQEVRERRASRFEKRKTLILIEIKEQRPIKKQ